MAVRVETREPFGGGDRGVDARAANDRIAEKADALRFLSRVPMVCECSTPGCRKLVMVSLDEYREIRSDPNNFLAAPGHEVEDADLQRETPAYDVHRARRSSQSERDGGQRSA